MSEASDQRIAPGLRQALPLPYSWLKTYQQDPVGFMLRNARKFGDPFRLQAGPIVLHTVIHPDYVQRVLHDNVDNYPRGLLYYVFRPGVGSGLITTDGEAWSSQRRIANEAFRPDRIANYAALTTNAAEGMMERWREYARKGQPFDLAQELLRVTLRVLSKVIFATDIAGDGDPAGRAIEDMEEYIAYTITHIHPPPAVPTGRNLRLKKALHTIDALTYRLIAERRGSGKDEGDALSSFVLARDPETGKGMSDAIIRDNVMSLFFAGHETIALSLAWMWYLLARNPDAAARLRDEAVSVLGGRTPTLADLPKLTYTRQVIQETLRLYPSVWLFEREAVAPDTIGGWHIPKKSQVFVIPFLTHRHEETWPNPESFDPDRFSPEQTANRHPYAYFPFCLGPHQCIGEHLGVMVMQLIAASVVQAYRLDLVSDSPVQPDGAVTVRPRGGVTVLAHELTMAAHA